MKSFSLKLKRQQLTFVLTNKLDVRMKLYLMRHGEALSPQVDPERGLSDNGKKNIARVAQELKQRNASFKHILHSTKKRARETAQIMCDIVSPDIPLKEHVRITPNDDPNLLLAEISQWNEDTLVASHLPFVPSLLTELTGEDDYLTAITFETGTIICLERTTGNHWEISWATAPSEIN